MTVTPAEEEPGLDLPSWPDPARPRAEAAATVERGRILLDGGASRPAAASAAVEHVWTQRAGDPAPLALPAHGARAAIDVPAADGEYHIVLTVTDAGGRSDSAAVVVAVRDGAVSVPDVDRDHPAWVDRAVGYGVVPELFGRPPLRAVAARLDDLRELGIDLLWLSPVNVTPPGDFGYAVLDYFAIDPRLGTEDDFHALVAAAHERGMRVIMDWVPNHTSREHPYFADTAERGEASPYWRVYDRDEHGEPTHYFDWTHLPNLNYDDAAVRAWMIAAAAYWVREHDVDGFRVDVAWGVKERRPDFWPQWRRELKRIKPDLLLLAEASARDPYYVANGFDAAYDWTDDLGRWAWEEAWAPAEGIASRLIDAIENEAGGGYHPDSLTLRCINQNDSPERFIAAHGPGLTRVAATLMLTLHGLPMVYTADEIGAVYYPYGDRQPLAWDDRAGLRPLYLRLIELRHTLPSLRSRTWHPLRDAAEDDVLAYVRAEPGHPPVLVALETRGEARTVTLRIPAPHTSPAAEGGLDDLLAGERLPAGRDGALEIPLQPYGTRIMVAAEETHA